MPPVSSIPVSAVAASVATMAEQIGTPGGTPERPAVFFRDAQGSGGPQLYSIDLTGRNEQRVATPNYGSDPAWSPALE